MSLDSVPPAAPCPNCGAPLAGPYCASCGQRTPRPGNVRKLVALQARRIGHTLFALVCRPGLLTVEFRDGQRARSIAPWRLLFNAVTVFFLMSVLTDFRIANIASGDTTGTITRVIAETAARTGVDANLVTERLDRRFNAVYTLLIALTVASYTIVAALTHLRQRPRRWDVHAIFATHLVAWIFVATLPYVVLLQALRLSPIVAMSDTGTTSGGSFVLLLSVFLWMYVYVVLAFRRIYGDSTPRAAAKAVVVSLVGLVVDNLVILLSFTVALRSL